MSTGPEGFGISEEDLIEIRGHAVLGAARDLVGPTRPVSQFESEESAARVEDLISRIMEEEGLSHIEASLFIAENAIEQAILTRNEGGYNGEDI